MSCFPVAFLYSFPGSWLVSLQLLPSLYPEKPCCTFGTTAGTPSPLYCSRWGSGKRNPLPTGSANRTKPPSTLLGSDWELFIPKCLCVCVCVHFCPFCPLLPLFRDRSQNRLYKTVGRRWSSSLFATTQSLTIPVSIGLCV